MLFSICFIGLELTLSCLPIIRAWRSGYDMGKHTRNGTEVAHLCYLASVLILLAVCHFKYKESTSSPMFNLLIESTFLFSNSSLRRRTRKICSWALSAFSTRLLSGMIAPSQRPSSLLISWLNLGPRTRRHSDTHLDHHFYSIWLPQYRIP